MAQTKFVIWICDFLGLGFGLLGLLNFIDNTKAVLAFILGTTYAGFRLYYLVSRWQREKRIGDMELEEKEMALRERRAKQKHNN